MFNDYSFIGSEIRRIRKNRKISQKKLASIVGISEESLLRIENNHNNPRVGNLLEILEVLGIDFEIILMNDCGSSWNLINKQISAIDNDLENLALTNLYTNIDKLRNLRNLIPKTYETKLMQYVLYYEGIYEKDINKFRDDLLKALEINGKDLTQGFKNFYNNFEDKAKLILDHLI
ncbi:helix-turn-helix domain-containing protein [uncultured Anaerococcus sp.]|uniref:helix-turn-helix domain-containing protein n=1 Tax=uncultured Anaerococcus sp. TaxID=293428 RepID=UPI00261E097B|nr:helix-turn-helix transcriptional regulator [uncultured Anaerococcus sp.]